MQLIISHSRSTGERNVCIHSQLALSTLIYIPKPERMDHSGLDLLTGGKAIRQPLIDLPQLNCLESPSSKPPPWLISTVRRWSVKTTHCRRSKVWSRSRWGPGVCVLRTRVMGLEIPHLLFLSRIRELPLAHGPRYFPSQHLELNVKSVSSGFGP